MRTLHWLAGPLLLLGLLSRCGGPADSGNSSSQGGAPNTPDAAAAGDSASAAGVTGTGGAAGTASSAGAAGTASSADASGSGGEAGAPSCDPATGQAAPLDPCTAADPCTTEQGPLTEQNPKPTCITPDNLLGRPEYDDGEPRTWPSGGVERYACEYRPPGTSANAPRPLLLWFHGGGGDADNVYRFTSLRGKAEAFAFGPAEPGFILISVQGRNLHWPVTQSSDGKKHDFFYRDLASPSSNPDIAAVDDLIDELADEGVIDPVRVYVSGISNGGFFAQLYAIARHETATPGGNRVAAAAVYSAADPFERPGFEDPTECRLDPYPTSSVPIFLISRACDLITCNQAQQDRFVAEARVLMAPGFVVETWLETLQSRLQNPNVTWRILRGDGVVTGTCTAAALCGFALATVNHINWPDGVMDMSGVDHEPDLLQFLADHPLPR
jgi:predicted esterase